MRVAWGRVEMPWSMWQPDENNDPIEAARAGKLNLHVQESMLMAQKLAKIGMPIIISDWSAPNWAILGDPRDAFRNRSKGIYGYPLNPEKTGKIYKSIADYIAYLKQNYGVEPDLFSFNESDLGINIRHTGKEHADFIKGFGAYLASRGIATKMLLGDNSDATTFDFIIPAMNDPETHKYIGAISFHSWRGCDDETLKKWAGAAKKMNLPLLVAEGSTDAAAWTYPEIFYEQTFALYEINLYVRICSLCQPLSILQWQLTSDYSVLKGDGIYRTEGPLQPTRRFWNLKQLASTPEGAYALPASVNKEEVNCAVFGNLARGEYAVHMINNGAERPVEIKGFPPDITLMEVYVTDETRGMEKTGEIRTVNGSFNLNLPPAAMITLISKK
jgi:O-glycosyl hydrolase